jgi:hypothetical protein
VLLLVTVHTTAIPGEYFCGLLYERMGVAVPKQRVILGSSSEYLALVEGLATAEHVPEDIRLELPFVMRGKPFCRLCPMLLAHHSLHLTSAPARR